MSQHKFAVGQTVTLAASGLERTSGAYEIVRLMPAIREDLEPQYRVKSRAEAYERVVAEDAIMAAQRD